MKVVEILLLLVSSKSIFALGSEQQGSTTSTSVPRHSTTMTSVPYHSTTLKRIPTDSIKSKSVPTDITLSNILTDGTTSTGEPKDSTTSIRDPMVSFTSEKETANFISPTSVQTVSTEPALCSCSCDYFDKIEYWSNVTNQLQQYYELEEKLNNIKHLLSLNTGNLSSTIRKKTSSSGGRASAEVVGYVGVTILALVFEFINK
ncbi:uncharacterized protein LOC133197907 [Saccostrea echinata]|uniref:uncharacterized protein LOC133197907 n=1 Tax=Saccostrea echinata TaxID=191078 RepID=UPI002A8360BE|nr:uncharacterized protein LOC133197907 [Saccostrea echinata]